MHRVLIPAVAAAALLSATSNAQTYVTAPGGHITKPGDGDGSLLGIHPRIEGRTQIIDPSFPRGRRLNLVAVSWRCDELLTYSVKNGTGRKFDSLRYALSHADCAKFSKTFSSNYQGTLTEVFSGKITFPSLSGRCTSTWGNAGSITFSKPFAFNGVADLLQEWNVSKGTLSNGSTAALSDYTVDGCFGTASLVKQLYGGSPYAPGSRYLPAPPNEGNICADSQQPSGTDAFTRLTGNLYANNYATVSLRGKIQVTEANSYGMAKNAPYIGGIAIGGFDFGIDAKAKCNKWYAATYIPIAIFTGKTDSAGSTPRYLPKKPDFYVNGYAGMPVYAQAAWTDSKSGILSLTKAVKIILPIKPDGSYYGHKKACFLQTYKDEKGASVGPIAGESVKYNVVERFTLK